jgi:hypothetical protein
MGDNALVNGNLNRRFVRSVKKNPLITGGKLLVVGFNGLAFQGGWCRLSGAKPTPTATPN